MKSSRRLALRRETLTELTANELSAAAGAAAGPPSLNVPTNCSYADYNAYAQRLMLDLTLHQHCSWSCI
jgi:hypothetical protein